MRRTKLEKDAGWALEVLRRAPYMTVSMTRPDGTPYGVPLNVAVKDERILYFHCAGEGEKIDCIRHCPVVSVSAVSKCTPRYEEEKANFTEHFHSAIALGKAEFVDDRDEKILALRLICERYLPDFMDRFDQAIERSLDITTVIRITLTESPVGKCKPQS